MDSVDRLGYVAALLTKSWEPVHPRGYLILAGSDPNKTTHPVLEKLKQAAI